jgi:hypothetical protein
VSSEKAPSPPLGSKTLFSSYDAPFLSLLPEAAVVER